MSTHLDGTEQISLDRLRGMRKHLRELVEHAGWNVFREYVGSLQDTLVRELVLNPLQTMDGALAQEYKKGKYAGLDQVLNDPTAWLADLDARIASAEAAEVAEQRAKKEPANVRREQQFDPINASILADDERTVPRRSP